MTAGPAEGRRGGYRLNRHIRSDSGSADTERSERNAAE
jgi:hypothetical protein